MTEIIVPAKRDEVEFVEVKKKQKNVMMAPLSESEANKLSMEYVTDMLAKLTAKQLMQQEPPSPAKSKKKKKKKADQPKESPEPAKSKSYVPIQVDTTKSELKISKIKTQEPQSAAVSRNVSPVVAPPTPSDVSS